MDLRDYVERIVGESDRRNQQRFEAQEKAVQAALAGAERAVTKAEAASEKRFDSLNEIRGAMADQAAHLMGREEANIRMASIEKELQAAVARIDRAEGSGSGLKAGWGYLIAGLGILLAMLAFFGAKP